MNDSTDIAAITAVDLMATMQFSRSELEALCSKAARGAGMSWGLAEEAGYACGWLLGRGIDASSAFAVYLHLIRHKDWHSCFPVVRGQVWRADSNEQPLCPIVLGATLSDHASVQPTLFEGQGLNTEEVYCPHLLLPFLAWVVQDLNRPLYLSVNEHVVCVDLDLRVLGDLDALLSVEAAAVCVSMTVSELVAGQLLPFNDNAVVHDHYSGAVSVLVNGVSALEKLALRTTVPPSAASRENAGASQTDND